MRIIPDAGRHLSRLSILLNLALVRELESFETAGFTFALLGCEQTEPRRTPLQI